MAQQATPSHRRILIADANAQSRRFLIDLGRSNGWTTPSAAETADHALSLLDSTQHHVLICNWSAGLDALALLRRVRASGAKDTQRVRVILLRLEPTPRDVLMARDAGADEVLAMPLCQKTFVRVTQRLLNTPLHFVDSQIYKGPDRRRRRVATENERRKHEAPEPEPSTDDTAIID